MNRPDHQGNRKDNLRENSHNQERPQLPLGFCRMRCLSSYMIPVGTSGPFFPMLFGSGLGTL